MLGRAFRLLSWGPPLWAVYTYVGHPSMVSGRSMDPTLRDNRDIVWISCFGTMLGHEPRRGDIVVLTSPEDASSPLVKRVVGKQGDWMRIRRDNGLKLVSRGHLWVEGDNGARSRDSQHFGPVSEALLVGRVTHRLFPLSEAGALARVLPAAAQGSGIRCPDRNP